MVNIRFDFDPKKIQREVEKSAEKAYFDAVERARRSLGAGGERVKVMRLATPRREGTNLTFGELSFPNEPVKQRFKEALKREFR